MVFFTTYIFISHVLNTNGKVEIVKRILSFMGNYRGPILRNIKSFPHIVKFTSILSRYFLHVIPFRFPPLQKLGVNLNAISSVKISLKDPENYGFGTDIDLFHYIVYLYQPLPVPTPSVARCVLPHMFITRL